MKVQHSLLMLFIVASLASCKKCYTCDIYTHCAECEVYDENGSSFGSDKFCGEKKDVDDTESSLKQTYEMYGYDVNCTRTKTLDDIKQVCGKKSDAEDRVLILELAGYTCIED